jgi:hypothetical protein
MMALAYRKRFEDDLDHLEVDEAFLVNGPDEYGRGLQGRQRHRFVCPGGP